MQKVFKCGLPFLSALIFLGPSAIRAQQNSNNPLHTVSVKASGNSSGELTLTTTGGTTPEYHPSRVLVRFRPGLSGAFLPGSGEARAVPGTPDLFLVKNPAGLSVAEAVRRYRANPNVLYAEPDYVVKSTAIPSDALWSQQWDMAKISAPAAWDTQTNANDVVVMVIDTGIDFTHPDLQANLWTDPTNSAHHGFTCMNGACAPGGQDDFGHGTHVAGTIGATTNNSLGIAGINWRVQLLSCKFLDSTGGGQISDAVLCFNQALTLKQQGVNIRVTSNSWGGNGFSQALKDAMSAVESAGVVDVCAAGNNGLNADISPMYPGAFDNRGLISVLASDSNDVGASFTNYGLASVDIAAPGVSTLSTVPTGSCSLCDPSGYRFLSGTSMATPHVTGVVAAVLHRNPSLTAAQARDIILDPGSYDTVTDPLARSTSTGGRLNFAKAVASPMVASPKLNSFPVVTGVSNATANAGDAVSLGATASDPDGDPLRMLWMSSAQNGNALWLLGWMLTQVMPASSGNTVSFQAPSLTRTAVAPYVVSVADGKGGSASAQAYATVLPTTHPGLPPSATLTVSPTSGPVGTVVSINFPAVDPEGGPVAWDIWQTSQSVASGICCQTSPSYNLPINAAGVYRISTQAIDKELNFSTRQTAVVRIGGATGTPPIAGATFDKLTGPAPLTVNIDMSASTDPDGTIKQYIIVCQNGMSGVFQTGKTSTCTYDTPGTYWIWLEVLDNDNLVDTLSAYAVVTPTTSSSGKTPASVALSNLTQTYTGSALTPTAITNPPGLAITWTNAPQIAAGTYGVTATVSDPNYQGSASGTFSVNKQAASVALSNLTQTYTGSALMPLATTTPPGLAVSWTNAPQTQPGSYSVTATVNDPNYQGKASGTFTIIPATASTPPAVSIISPSSGKVSPGPVIIQATVTPGTYPVTHVDFLVNGSVKCSDTSAPYACSWNMPAAQGKSYQLQAKAYDSGGQVGVSAIVTVTR
jgi:subtilisin family serine protease